VGTGGQRRTQRQNKPKPQVPELKRTSAEPSFGLLEALVNSQITRKSRASSEADTKSYIQTPQEFDNKPQGTPDPTTKPIDSLPPGGQRSGNTLMKLLYIGGREKLLAIITLLHETLLGGVSSIYTVQEINTIRDIEDNLEAYSPRGALLGDP